MSEIVLKLFSFEPKPHIRDQKGIDPVVIIQTSPEEALKQMEAMHKNHWVAFDPRQWDLYEKPVGEGKCIIIYAPKKLPTTIKHDTMVVWMKLVKAREI